MSTTLPLKEFVWRPEGQGRLSSELGKFEEAMRGAFPEVKRIAFSASMADPRNVELYELGYKEGKHQGFAAAYGDFKGRLAYTLRLLYSLVDPEVLPYLVAGSIATWLQAQGTPPPEALKRRFEAVLWYKQLESFVPYFEIIDKGKVLETLALVAGDVVEAMREAGVAWVDGFFALTGSPREQGRYAGYLIGRACGEVFFSAIEEIGQVPLFDDPSREDQDGEVAP